MTEFELAEKAHIVSRYRQSRKIIRDLNELIEVVAGEWKYLRLTCECDPDKKQGCSICEITLRLQGWQDERDAEGPQG